MTAGTLWIARALALAIHIAFSISALRPLICIAGKVDAIG